MKTRALLMLVSVVLIAGACEKDKEIETDKKYCSININIIPEDGGNVVVLNCC
ncbi:hypothetical protein SAMN05444274_11319 [Mariniphaga anaerophila]|uniref:Lipoprotein n=1 Tax=Mariniphaga anaerophila TaxID=1484053 RepID=A0A1M5FLC2_9BACT|nr:hypothetical protein SAMN05444274_11319 [Mariniphaga anaerophila]